MLFTLKFFTGVPKPHQEVQNKHIHICLIFCLFLNVCFLAENNIRLDLTQILFEISDIL